VIAGGELRLYLVVHCRDHMVDHTIGVSIQNYITEGRINIKVTRGCIVRVVVTV